MIRKKVFTVLAALLFYTQAATGGGKSSEVTFKGNVIELVDASDTVMIVDPVTGNVETAVTNSAPIPVKINGRSIYSTEDADELPSVDAGTVNRYLVRKLNNLLSNLPDGQYRLDISNIVLDEQGKIVYYHFEGLKQSVPTGDVTQADNQRFIRHRWEKHRQNEIIAKEIDKIIEQTANYTPAKVGGIAIPYRIPDPASYNIFQVKNGVITYTR